MSLLLRAVVCYTACFGAGWLALHDNGLLGVVCVLVAWGFAEFTR